MLPAGVSDVTSSDGGVFANGKVTWNLPVTNSGLNKEVTVTFKPAPGISVNGAQAWAMSTAWMTVQGKSVKSTFHASTCTPEFPSAFLPATMIVGFLGVILYIRRTKEN
jgi:autotransporter translocation and assembly factor TamB